MDWIEEQDGVANITSLSKTNLVHKRPQAKEIVYALKELYEYNTQGKGRTNIVFTIPWVLKRPTWAGE
jgi:hypothetical protein